MQQQNGFSYQPQTQAFPAQHQQFATGSSHTQTHQHPQAFSGSMSLEGPSDISWDYGFGFETNPLTTIGEDGGAYGNQLPAASNPNRIPNPSAFQAMSNTIPAQQAQQAQQQRRQQQQQQAQQPQHHHHQQLPQQQQQQHPQHPQHPHQHQHQLNASHPSGQVYASGQGAGFGRNMQQSQPQGIAQAISSKPVMDFQQSMANQHQQHQPVIPQHQHQQSNPLQAGARQNPQLQSLSQTQQISRVGTPQSMAAVNQSRQSPFNGRTVTPIPMQQHGSHIQFPIQDTRGSAATPFSVPQQTSVINTSANLSNISTTQSRFMPSQVVAPQQPPQSPVPQTSAMASMNTIPRGQKDNQAAFQPVMQSNAVPNNQPRVSTPMATAPAWQEQHRPGPEQPRVVKLDEKDVPICGSRHVGLAFTAPMEVDPDADENQTIHDVSDPSEYAGLSFGSLFPSLNGQPRILASQILQNWASALIQGDLAGQAAQEQRLRQHFGKHQWPKCSCSPANSEFLDGSIPKRYEDKIQKFKSLHQKSLAKRGPVRRSPGLSFPRTKTC